eukprot:9503159-Pyramimonas_sp.AAC.1
MESSGHSYRAYLLRGLASPAEHLTSTGRATSRTERREESTGSAGVERALARLLKKLQRWVVLLRQDVVANIVELQQEQATILTSLRT